MGLASFGSRGPCDAWVRSQPLETTGFRLAVGGSRTARGGERRSQMTNSPRAAVRTRIKNLRRRRTNLLYQSNRFRSNDHKVRAAIPEQYFPETSPLFSWTF